MFNQTILKSLLTATFLLVLAGCSSGGGDSATSSVSSSLSGVAQKGAFLKDSNVTLCKLDEKMLCTSDVLESKVSDDKGSYEFKTLPWSGRSRLSISGYYFDELTGKTSLFPATITAIVNIKSNVKQRKNTNLLTDMRAKRMKDLVEKGKSVDEASDESKDDVKKLFNVSSDDFTSLDLADFSEGKASVNVELLRISAAVANAQDPVGTLEELMKIYKDDGIEAVLNSSLYRTLMGLIEKVKVKEVLTKMVGADEANAATITDIAPFAVANIVTFGVVNSDDKVRITLIGTEFIDAPSISVSSSDNLLGIDKITLSDDNKSAILDMNRSTSCEDINATFTIDYTALKNLTDPIRTNKLKYKDENSMCTTSNVDDNENTTPITVDPTAVISLVPLHKNQIRLTLLGTEFENYVNSISTELITTSSSLVIVDTKVADNNKSVVFTLNEDTNYCAENNVTIGLYTNNLKDVPNESDTFKSNKIKYVSPNTMAECSNGNATTTPIPFNRAPTVSITPSTIGSISVNTVLELNATAVDVNSEDRVTLQWRYKRVDSTGYELAGTSVQFTQEFISAGHYIVEVNATDNHGASTQASIVFEVLAVNHRPTVSISPSEDKNIHIGESVLLKSRTADEDGDELSVSWKLKESAESDFTTVANYGGTGFRHTFDAIGTYLVVVEVVDGNGSKADANITVTVGATHAVEMTLSDINISVVVKGHTNAITTNGTSDILDEAHENPQHGEVSYFKIGNEVPAFTYTSTDCFIGTDTFSYKSGDEYGRVNVTITSPFIDSTPNLTKTLYNNETVVGENLVPNNPQISITAAPSHGLATLRNPSNEYVLYDYDPNDNYNGSDSFEYTLTQTVDSCSYSSTGRVDLTILKYVESIVLPFGDASHGVEVWSTDGTADGTQMISDVRDGNKSSIDLAYYELYRVNNAYYYSSSYWDGGSQYANFYKVTTDNVALVKADFFAAYFVTLNDTLYFHGNTIPWTQSQGRLLYKSDGTLSGTQIVKDMTLDTNKDQINTSLFTFNNNIFYSAETNNGSDDRAVWKSDGTESGTAVFIPTKDWYESGYGVNEMVEAGGKLFFAGYNTYTTDSLYTSDGTNYTLLKVINSSASAEIMYMEAVENKLFFVAKDGSSNYHDLWVSDGTESGTIKLKSSSRSSIGSLKSCNSKLYYSINQTLNVSDGTVAGTLELSDFNVLGTDGYIEKMECHNDMLYITVGRDGDSFDYELYAIDTSVSTTPIVVNNSSGYFSLTLSPYLVEDSIIYTTQNATHYEMWKYNKVDGNTLIKQNSIPKN